jgi:cytochrome c5
MKGSGIKPILCLTATLVCGAAAYSAVQPSQPAQPAQLPPVKPGEKILNSACTTCHELRAIETTALDEEGWTKIVNAMVEKGAEVKKDDMPVLVKYLVSAYGPLPDGAGKAVLLNVCTQCHTLDRVRVRGGDRQSWEDLLNHMLNEGAPLSDEDYTVLLRYLARNFSSQ